MNEALILSLSLQNMEKLEGPYAKAMAPILNSIYRAAAQQVDAGNFRGADLVVDRYAQRVKELLIARFIRCADVFGRLSQQLYAPKSYNLKAPLSQEYWETMERWAQHAANLSEARISFTSKQMIAGVVLRGLRDGKGVTAISKDLRTTGILTSKVRANTIARTETHTAANYSTQTMVNTLGATEKKWLNSGDERVRTSHRNVMGGDWIKVGEKFYVGGDEMDAPGIGGGGNNTINCRCVAMYR